MITPLMALLALLRAADGPRTLTQIARATSLMLRPSGLVYFAESATPKALSLVNALGLSLLPSVLKVASIEHGIALAWCKASGVVKESFDEERGRNLLERGAQFDGVATEVLTADLVAFAKLAWLVAAKLEALDESLMKSGETGQ